MSTCMDEFVNNTDISQNRPLREVVYESLRNTLINGNIPVGERIIETEYSQRLNISRTPVREALKQLEQENLVEYIPKIGVVVKKITKNDVIEIYKIREALEILVTKCAMENITQDEIDAISQLLDDTEKANEDGDINKVINLFSEFNSMIYKSSKMKKLPIMIDKLNNYLLRFRNISILNDTRREKALLEHKLIFNAIINKNKEIIPELIKNHLEYSLLVVLEKIDSNIYK